MTIERRADRASAVTLGADKAFDAADFVNDLRAMNIPAARGAGVAARPSTCAQISLPQRRN